MDAIRGEGGEATFVRADVSNVDDVKALMQSAKEAYGRLDVLHNNAGVHETNFTAEAQSIELPEEIWDRVIDDQPQGNLDVLEIRRSTAGRGRRWGDRQRRLDRRARRLPDGRRLRSVRKPVSCS